MGQELIEAEVIIPAPMMTEDSRLKLWEAERQKLRDGGFMIMAERRVKNTAFDFKNDRTTLKIKIRPASLDEKN